MSWPERRPPPGSSLALEIGASINCPRALGESRIAAAGAPSVSRTDGSVLLLDDNAEKRYVWDSGVDIEVAWEDFGRSA